MTELKDKEFSPTSLADAAKAIRLSTLRMTHHAGMGHTGGSLSEAEILAALYFRVMRRLDPKKPDKPDRDRFILSKGHATPGYYSVLALRGYFPEADLETFDSLGSTLQAHPDMRKARGVDMSTGSLGQGLSAGIGMAIASRLRPEAEAFRTFVLLGDGELQEGQPWEAISYAGERQVPGIVAIVDRNGVQLSTALHEAAGAESLARAWEAFGWYALVADGHDAEGVAQAIAKAAEMSDKGPAVVVAKTVKGKGVSFMEGRYEWHGKAPNDEEYARALAELGV